MKAPSASILPSAAAHTFESSVPIQLLGMLPLSLPLSLLQHTQLTDGQEGNCLGWGRGPPLRKQPLWRAFQKVHAHQDTLVTDQW